MAYPKSNKELREMAVAALDNWYFDAETDPEGDIKNGLDYLAAQGDVVADEDIEPLFEGYPRHDEWEILSELALNIGRSGK